MAPLARFYARLFRPLLTMSSPIGNVGAVRYVVLLLWAYGATTIASLLAFSGPPTTESAAVYMNSWSFFCSGAKATAMAGKARPPTIEVEI